MCVSGADRGELDALRTQMGVTKQLVHPINDPLIRSPVRRQLVGVVHLTGGSQVCMDVRPTEGVDRLLRITDEPQVTTSMERRSQNLPLQGVGVLELVNHDQMEPVGERRASHSTTLRGAQRAGQVLDEVVEGVQPTGPHPA